VADKTTIGGFEHRGGENVSHRDIVRVLHSPELAALVLDNLPAAVILADADGQIVAANQVAVDLWRADDVPVADWARGRQGWWGDSGVALGYDDWPLIRAVTEGVATHAVVIDILRFDKTSASVVDSAQPILDEDGRIIGAMAVAHDISSERRNHLFNRTLARVNSAITSQQSFDDVMRLALRETVEAVGAESGVVYVRGSDNHWAARFVHGLPDELVGKQFLDEEIYYSVLAVETGGQVVINDPANDPRVHASLIGLYDIKAIMDVPLIVGDDLIGDFCMHHHSDRKFTEEEAVFARNVASSMTLALRHAKLVGEERLVAVTLQEALLLMPETLPGVEIAHFYRSASDAARVGGDFYDVFEVEPGTIGIVLGDISGKGVEAATQISLIKSAIRAYSFEGYRVEIVLQKANGLLEQMQRIDEFVTVFYGTFTPASGRLAYCNAGHPPGFVKRLQGLEPLPPTGPVLGAFPEAHFDHGETTLSPGDELVLYTDGVIEVRDGADSYGAERLEAVLLKDGPLKDLPRRILDDVLAYAGHLSDDIAILVLAPSEPSAGR
jgi:serine phosphatase RsbU (regulator of sigma subunit)